MGRRKKGSGLDDFFKCRVAMPWWVGPICAALVFIFLRFIIPAIFGNVGDPNSPMAKSFNAMLVPISTGLAPYAGLFVLVIWGVAEGKKFINRKRLDSQTGLDSIGDLSWQEFEELVAEAYRREGYEAQVTGNAAGDGGVDVVLRRRGQRTLVQCKHWKTWTVGVQIVRELRGVMASEKADYGIVVSYGTFTPEAEAFAKQNRITLIGGDDLVKMIRSVQRTPRIATAVTEVTAQIPFARPVQMVGSSSEAAPSCPRCGTAMVLRTSKRGASVGSQFWGCPKYPGCQGTRPR